MELPTPDNNDEEIIKLETQLGEVLAAEKFPETESGRLWMQLATSMINRAVADITSDKYQKDHMGYLKRLADLQAYKNMVRAMQIAASPVRKQKILDALPEDNAKQ
jgi:hypothetical protein